MFNVTVNTHKNNNSSLTHLTQSVISPTEPIYPTLKPLISAEEFLRSAPKVIPPEVVSPTSDVKIKNQLSCTLLPTQSDSKVIYALKTLGLYKKPMGNGKHDITCPWVAEHTKGRDNGTVYFEGKRNNSNGGFKCKHYHCCDRTTSDFIFRLEVLIAELEVTE